MPRLPPRAPRAYTRFPSTPLFPALFASVSPPGSYDGFRDAVDTMVLGLPDRHVQARFLLALLSAPNPARTQDGLLAIAHRVFGLYGGLKRLARRAGSIAAVIAEDRKSTRLNSSH